MCHVQHSTVHVALQGSEQAISSDEFLVTVMGFIHQCYRQLPKFKSKAVNSNLFPLLSLKHLAVYSFKREKITLLFTLIFMLMTL